MTQSRFITLEGGEGAGKSTQARLLAAHLSQLGHRVTLTREPGGAPGAEAIRHLLVTGETGRWTPRAEALLHFAAREEHLVHTVRPALVRGEWVICDRFVDSSFAYQGAALGLGRDFIESLRKLVVGEDMPVLTLILDIDVTQGMARASGRANAKDIHKENHSREDRFKEDRYERMDAKFHETLRQAFLSIASADPRRCAVIDAAQSEEAVAKQIWNTVSSRLGL